ncbi:alpha/beta fold hydrolase [bacterium]|nr:alpha/beta fold hydrolase [bacterium]
MQLATSLVRLLKRDPRTHLGGRFIVHSEGRGRDVVFIHGLAASPACWEDVPTRLPTVRSHTLHIRGFAGEKPFPKRMPGNFLKPLADEVAAYVRSHTRGRAALCGHSMGGLVALIVARDHPDVVDRVMVVDVPAFFSVLINPFATTGSYLTGFADLARRRYIENDHAAFEDTLRRTVQTLVVSDIARERVVHWGLTSDRETTADVMAEVMTTDLRADLPSIQSPVDVVYAWDRGLPMSRAGLDQTYASAYSGLADHRRLRIDNARHYVMFDQPGPFYASVAEWLKR